MNQPEGQPQQVEGVPPRGFIGRLRAMPPERRQAAVLAWSVLLTTAIVGLVLLLRFWYAETRVVML